MAAANRHKLLHWRHNFSPELTLKPAFKLKADNLLDFEWYYRIPRFLLINCNVSQHIMVGPKPDSCGCQSQFLLFFLQHFYCTQYDNSDGMNSGRHKRELPNKPLAMLRLPLIPFSAARVIVILTPAVLRWGETPIDCFFTTFNIGCFTTAWSHVMKLNWPLNEDSLKFLPWFISS